MNLEQNIFSNGGNQNSFKARESHMQAQKLT